MEKIFRWAFNPNDDADVHRDELFSRHIQRLALIVTPDHPAIQIRTAFHNEAPWWQAQEELQLLWAYKTPSDKARCILRVCRTVVTLLSLATERGSGPGADDLIPVMVYVIVQANPRALLSTVQYVSSLHAASMEGHDSYCWLQFCSAIEFIKTINE
uniref:GTPase-activating protein and VPS9 domain-containing protein 1-like n=1 Tax=Petromyzon marinus TaxID=7757 RepID=A0AAJ7U9N8_PETMA|nr:GTPase-activating protein and VPS9 domain-containing protein 1-like [Petromyzon marinus]